jgi:hypothetical protein
MKLQLSTEPADTVKQKCLVLGVFADEKPPRGICGFVDWRLNGYISREIKQGNISGKLAEKILVPAPPRLNAELLMICGMGNASKFTTEQMERFAYLTIESVDKLLLDDFSLELPGPNRVNLPLADVAEATARGFYDYLAQDAKKINKIKSCLLTLPEQSKEATAGVKSFKAKI